MIKRYVNHKISYIHKKNIFLSEMFKQPYFWEQKKCCDNVTQSLNLLILFPTSHNNNSSTNKDKILRWNPLGNWAIFIFSGQKPVPE